MARLVGSIDIGTSRIKAVAFNEDWAVARSVEFKLDFSIGSSGRVEHDPTKLLSAVKAALERLRDWGVCCAGISVFRGSVLAWRRGGEALTPIATWMDRRALAWRPPFLVRLARVVPVIRTALLPGSPALLLRVLLEEHGLLGEARRGEVYAWTLDAFIAHSLSGRFTADPASAALTGLIDPRSLQPLRVVEALLGLRGLVHPELLAHDSIVADYKGLEVGPIIADQQASAVGLGCLFEGCLKITMGTGVFVDEATGKPGIPLSPELVPVILVSTSAHGRLYGVEGFAAGVGLAVDLLLEAGVLRGYEELDTAPPRAPRGVLLMPSLGGLRTPYSPEAGLLLAISRPARREDLVAALAHGLALTAASIALRVSSYAGAPRVVRVGGGLARSRRVVELLSSYMGSPLEAAGDHYDSARGAALLAALARGALGWRDLLTWRPRGALIEAEPHVNEARAWYEALKAASSSRVWRLLWRL